MPGLVEITFYTCDNMNLKKIKDASRVKVPYSELRKKGFTVSGIDYYSGLEWFIVYGPKEKIQETISELKEKYKGKVAIKSGHLRKSYDGQYEQEIYIKSSMLSSDKKKKAKDSVSRFTKAIKDAVTTEDIDSDNPQEHDDPLKDRAAQLDDYANDLSKFVSEGLSTPQDIIMTIDENIDPDVSNALALELSEAMDWPESLDDTLWDYIQHTAEEGQQDKAFSVIVESPNLPDEVCVIVADEILSAYEIGDSKKPVTLKHKVKDSEEPKLYGATKEEWIEAGAHDSGGIGFETYIFTPKALGQMAADLFNDGMAGFPKPESVKAWETEHNIPELAKKEAASLNAEDYTYYGGVLVYIDDEGYSTYKVFAYNE